MSDRVLPFLMFDGRAEEAVRFHVSLFVECTSQERMRGLVEKLSEGGQVFMPLDDYGFSKRFAWVTDKSGVSWQRSLG